LRPEYGHVSAEITYSGMSATRKYYGNKMKLGFEKYEKFWKITTHLPVTKYNISACHSASFRVSSHCFRTGRKMNEELSARCISISWGLSHLVP
jgi:hypothetical protein